METLFGIDSERKQRHHKMVWLHSVYRPLWRYPQNEKVKVKGKGAYFIVQISPTVQRTLHKLPVGIHSITV